MPLSVLWLCYAMCYVLLVWLDVFPAPAVYSSFLSSTLFFSPKRLHTHKHTLSLFVPLFAIPLWPCLSISVNHSFSVFGIAKWFVCSGTTMMVSKPMETIHFVRTLIAPTNFSIESFRSGWFFAHEFHFTYRFQLQWFSFSLHRCCCWLDTMRVHTQTNKCTHISYLVKWVLCSARNQ